MEKYLPIILIVFSNIFYNISSKSTPSQINPFASLTLTYLTGAVAAGIMYFFFNRSQNIFLEYRNVNWSTFILGLSALGLETGSIYMYKMGWNISTGHLVHGTILAVCLILIGGFFYHESITPTKIFGILICITGLYLINK